MEGDRDNIKIIVKVIEAKDLLPADANGLSDPYLKFPHGQEGVVDLPNKQHKTKRIDNTINTFWNELFVIEYNPMKCTKLRVEVYDHDYIGKNDFLGAGYINLEWINVSSEKYKEEWLPLMIEKINENTKQKEFIQKGFVHVQIRVFGFHYLEDSEKKPYEKYNVMPQEESQTIILHNNGENLQPGTWIIVSEPEVFVGLGWDYSKKYTFDLDSSVTGFDINKELIEYVYYAYKKGLNKSVIHCGDNLTGLDSEDDKEVIQINLYQVPPNVHYLTVNINSFQGNSLINAKHAFIRLFTKEEKIGKYLLNRTKDCTGILLGVFERDQQLNIWYFRVMADPVEGWMINDSIPSLKKLLGNYSIDLGYNSSDMNKNRRHPYPNEVVFYLGKWIQIEAGFVYVGLGWNLQKGFNFDLDASILTFDIKNELQEIIYHKNLKSKDGAIIHKGDNKTGEGEGDKEILSIDFRKIDINTVTMAVIVNSFKGNSLINMLDGFIRLYDNYRPIGVNLLGNCPDTVGLFLGLFRRINTTWYFQAIKEPLRGTIAKDSVFYVKALLSKYEL